MQAGNYANTRYPTLDQINKDNVKDLQVAWTFSTGVLRGHEGSPLVIGDMMYVHTPFPNTIYALDLDAGRQDRLEVPAGAGPERHRRDVLRHRLSRPRLRRRHALPAPGRHHAGGARRQDRRGEVDVKNGDPSKGETNTATVLPVKDKVIVGISGGEFGVRGSLTAYNIKDGSLAWRAYSTGPDAEMLVDPEKTTALGKPIGKDSSLASWEGDQWKIGGGTTWGWYSYDPELEPRLLRHRQPLDLEPGAAARRQQVVDDDLRPRPGHRHGEVALPDDAARRVGLRRRQRDGALRRQHRRQGPQAAVPLRTATASPTRSTARPASSWSPTSTIRR